MNVDTDRSGTAVCVTGEDSPDSAAVKQLLHVVEGLEEELFSSEARRNDAEVTPALACPSIKDTLPAGLTFAELMHPKHIPKDIIGPAMG